MSRRPGHPPGDWIYDCPRCGFEIWASQARKEWTGLRVCSGCWDKRNPQDFVRGVADRQSVPFSNHPPDQFYYPYGNPPPAPGTWILANGIWSDAGFWIDTDFWRDGDPWILAGGTWQDAGAWDDTSSWID